MIFENNKIKKYLLAIVLLITSSSYAFASIEGRLFLELENEKGGLFCSLEKVLEKEIGEENIRGAFLNLKTKDSVVMRDLQTQTNYFLEKENGYFDITDFLKDRLRNGEQKLHFAIDSDFCTQDCGANEYGNIMVEYSLNSPPSLKLLRPENGSASKINDVFFEWEGFDSDGKFLEYSIEIDTDENFNSKHLLKSEWSSKKNFSINLDGDIYFWRIWGKDNSFLENIVVSDVYSFEILNFQNELKNPVIMLPKEGFLTNAKKVELHAKTDVGSKNEIWLNSELLEITKETNIKRGVPLKHEGENNIEIVSKRQNDIKKASVKIVTKWTPPSEPNFDLKLQSENVLVQIKNNDYEKAHIFFQEEFLKKIDKTKEWFDLGDQFYGEIKIGVMLEDEVGNKTEIVHKTLNIDELLGIGSSKPSEKVPNPSYCFFKYNITQRKITRNNCFITRPQILGLQNITMDNKTFRTGIAGVYNPDMIILIDEFRCTLPIVCAEKFVKTTRIKATPYTGVNVYINERFTSISEFKKSNNRYFFTTHIVGNTNLQARRVNLRYQTSHHFQYKEHWIDINSQSPYSYTRVVPLLRKVPSNKNRTFQFPFRRIIGVTQWHGYTAFQSPHTGVDFGSYREPIYAIGDGTIASVGWDSYYGKCLSGGNFIRIEHDNKMNSVYFHLENYKKANGNNWKAGERIKKNEQVGISGNSGAYNCQPLGYHLHFELRQRSPQSTHLNPVPYINVNWDSVPTLNHRQYPGRLTGDNPHPTW